jgi:glycosyltransferase involved in cell wall biosynthesis
MQNQICIVIPVYNNPKTIQSVVEESLALNLKIIVVDDGSDTTVSSLLTVHPHLTILRHEANKGKGQAILTAAREAKAQNFESILTIDGDGQHYPKESKYLLPLLNNNAIVIGNRKFKEDVPNASKFGRAFSNFWIFAETGRWLHDTQSGFRGYPLSILDLELKHSYYDFEIEIIVKHLWKKRPIHEVEIEVYYPPHGERVSHFDKVKDNIRLSKIHTKLVTQNILRLFRF